MINEELYDRVQKTLERIRYKFGLEFYLDDDQISAILVSFRLHGHAIDTDTGAHVAMAGATAWVTPDMTDDQIIREAYKLCQRWEEHELNEYFQVDGVTIHNPHRTIDSLIERG